MMIFQRKRRNGVTDSLVAVACTLMVLGVENASCAAQRSNIKQVRARQDDNSLIGALREAVPPVTIHEVIFAGPVELVRMESVNDQGRSTGTAPQLEAIGSGLVIDRHGRVYRLETGGRVSVGDIIVGGVIENIGYMSARLSFLAGRGAHDKVITLDPGERLYIGSKERLLRDPSEAGGGAIALKGQGGPLPSGGPGTHCPVCACDCSYNGGSCAITIDAENSTDSNRFNNTACECVVNGNTKTGTTGDCFKKFVPCVPQE